MTAAVRPLWRVLATKVCGVSDLNHLAVGLMVGVEVDPWPHEASWQQEPSRLAASYRRFVERNLLRERRLTRSRSPRV